MKPKIRHEAKASLTNIIQSAIEREHNFIYQSCLNCEHFKEQNELCLLVNKRPPARVIVLSCNAWMERDTIPF